MMEKTCCFTGHRSISSNQKSKIAERLEAELIRQIEQGYMYFGAGGALGFDTVASLTVLRLKVLYSHIKLILVLPCLAQSKGWAKEDQIVYEKIKNNADKIVYVSEIYTSGCMLKRNRHLVDHSSLCICYLNKSSGGTAYTVEYAKKQGKAIINIAER